MRLRITLALAAFLVSQTAFAVITFDQLADNLFVVSHRVKGIGSRGQAMRLVYEKAASLCVAAGFEYYAILDQESAASQEYEAANASIRVQFFQSNADGRIECDRNASVEYVDQAREKLAKQGYVPPAKTPEPAVPAASGAATAAGSSCTVEQITAMVKAGLSPEQIKAACPDNS
jgi:hypothetical protein